MDWMTLLWTQIAATDWSSVLTDDAGALATVLIKGLVGYVGLVFMLRITGNRTLSQLNAFDMIVTVAMGSTLASLILSSDVSILEGLLALATLILLQFAITFLAVRSDSVRRAIKSEPVLLYYGEEFCRDSMQASRVVEAEIYAAMRQQGIGSLGKVQAVVLETNGKLSIIQDSDADTRRALSKASLLPEGALHA